MDACSIVAVREFYARLMVAKSGSQDERLIAAFSATPREQFLSDGPWKVATPSGYVDTLTSDPRVLYQDIVVGIALNRSINNGEPSLHARCLSALAVKEGECAIHIGAGSGYYSAILGCLTGESGRVYAYETEPDLADAASRNLAGRPNVVVRKGSGVTDQLPRCDVIYASAGATHPSKCWLAALKINGRLLFPLTDNAGAGFMLLLERKTVDYFRARFLLPAWFVPCHGARDANLASSLREAFNRGDERSVQSLRLTGTPDSSCWFSAPGWWLSKSS
jgi:protein-L-isoaspartate(D-aspartate) O-methyltransferase